MQHLEKMKEVFEEYYKWNPLRIVFFGNLISSIIRSRVAQKRISQFNNQKEGVFLVA